MASPAQAGGGVPPCRLLPRRRMLTALGGAALATAGAGGVAWLERPSAAGRPISPWDPEVAAVERRRPWSGRTVRTSLLPRLGQVDLAGRVVDTWLYDRQLPGPELRVSTADELEVTVTNALPEPTSVHWHGIRIRCDMDGVPGMTEPPLAPTASLTYRFRCADPGTYWYHPHVGVQRDRGLYGALVVEDPHDPVHVDLDETVVLDDWIDGVEVGGVALTPDAVLDRLRAGLTTAPTTPVIDASSPWGPMLGSVDHPVHLLNGRPADDPPGWRARPGHASGSDWSTPAPTPTTGWPSAVTV